MDAAREGARRPDGRFGEQVHADPGDAITAPFDMGTAAAVAEWDNGLPVGDADRVRETLYRAVDGSWFMHGEGGANSLYGDVMGDGSRTSGEALWPVDDRPAQVWALANGGLSTLTRDDLDEVELHAVDRHHGRLNALDAGRLVEEARLGLWRPDECLGECDPYGRFAG